LLFAVFRGYWLYCPHPILPQVVRPLCAPVAGGWVVSPHPGAVSYNPVPALGVGAAWLRRLRGSLHTQAGVEFSFAPCRFPHSAPWVHCLRVHVSLTFHSSIIARGHAITLFCYISLQ
jgi:hypothetical protein